MSIVSSTGLGSGIDIQSLVTQLATAETQPQLNAIQRHRDTASARLSGLGTLKSALSDFQTAINALKDGSAFRAHTSSSSDESKLKITADAYAATGTYSLEITQLAKAKKAVANVEFTGGVTSALNSGTLSFSAASGDSFDITVDSSNNTLEKLRDAINKADGNTFVSASIVNVDNATHTGTVSKLVLTAKNTGTASGFTVSGTDDGTIGGNVSLSQLSDANLDIKTPAQDAVISIDGQVATRSSNSITDVLPGVTLNLAAQTEVNTPVTINVGIDNDAIANSINAFVTAYNKLNSTVKNLGKYGGSTDGSGSGNGALIGDSTLRYVATQIRQNTTGTVSSASGNFNSLAMIGVSIDKAGVMSLDSAKLKTALAANFQSVSDVFSSTDGVATRLAGKLSGLLQSGGSIDSQQTSLNKTISKLDDQKDDVNVRFQRVQAALQKQFIAMDSAVGQFKSTGSFLTNWINSL
ncbi:flagellar filament capping protein FliD [Methylomonas koyamae]|uniref:Flagellar hook-associated protein 2 n=2 Tax=Methylomonas koyamae TaxID=702114 RepID=A0AA91DDY1_9GAMM|nr:flagellar filament capping protein FliD [Methylomonas koyamae]OAI27719.1 flagellar hook protein [Methylomonas koyamae]BBL59948.1 B-type flagellar hook-associated protein 2 [Methylomonas koyamae]